MCSRWIRSTTRQRQSTRYARLSPRVKRGRASASTRREKRRRDEQRDDSCALQKSTYGMVVEEVLEHASVIWIVVVDVLDRPVAIGVDHQVHRLPRNIFAVLLDDVRVRLLPVSSSKAVAGDEHDIGISAERPASRDRCCESHDAERAAGS